MLNIHSSSHLIFSIYEKKDEDRNLLKVKEDIIKAGGKSPKSLIVITKMTNSSYLKDDGVYVTSIFALKNWKY